MYPQYYFNGDGYDPVVQSAIKKNFIALMKNPGFMPPQFCSIDQQCTEENVMVYVGESAGTANSNDME